MSQQPNRLLNRNLTLKGNNITIHTMQVDSVSYTSWVLHVVLSPICPVNWPLMLYFCNNHSEFALHA